MQVNPCYRTNCKEPSYFRILGTNKYMCYSHFDKKFKHKRISYKE